MKRKKRPIIIFMVLTLLLSGMIGSLPKAVYAQDDNPSAVMETDEKTSTDATETDVTDDKNTENLEDTPEGESEDMNTSEENTGEGSTRDVYKRQA